MSASPKYTEARLTGEAAKALASATAEANRRLKAKREAQAELRRIERLRQQQAQVREITQSLGGEIQRLESQADAGVIRDILAPLRERFDRCANKQATDLSQADSLLSELSGVQRDLLACQHRLETIRLTCKLKGAAGQLRQIEAQIKQMNARDCERFDPGTPSMITQSITAIQQDLAAKRLSRVETGITDLHHRLDQHVKRVRAGQDEHDRLKRQAAQAIAAVVDRYAGFQGDKGLGEAIAMRLQRLQPEVDVLDRHFAREQFGNVNLQVARLNGHLDQIAAAVATHIQSIEKQKAHVQGLIQTIASMRGQLASRDEPGKGVPSRITFNIGSRRRLHIEIRIDGPLVVRAEGFAHDQRVLPDGKLEKSCDEFVAWFEQVREAAAKEGIEIGPLRWDDQPPQGMSRAARQRQSRPRVTRQTRTRSL